MIELGDRVKKTGGDYSVYGTVKSVIRKESGAIRYTVEAAIPDGLLHIYSAANLQPMTSCDEFKLLIVRGIIKLLRL